MASALHVRDAQAEALRVQAEARLSQAVRVSPADFRTLCERTRSALGAADARGSRPHARSSAPLLQLALERRAYLDDALWRLARAQELAPQRPQIAFALARVLALWEEPRDLEQCSVRRRDAQAIAAFERVRALDPDYRTAEVAFQLGVLSTRTHAFEAAAQAYKRAIAHADQPDDAVTAYANLAEVTMLAGDPAQALEYYGKALASTQGGRDYALALFGAAVALDRLGEHAAALEKAGQALEAAGRSLALLRAPGVFFEPSCERDYYEALGNEALAKLVPETRDFALDAAESGYRAFLANADSDNPYRINAQLALDALAGHHR